MSKRFAVLCLAAILAAIAAPAAAGGIGTFITTWDASDVGDDQGVGVLMKFDFNETWKFEMRASYLNGFSFVTQNELFDLEVAPLDVGFSYEFRPFGRAIPYAGAGASYYFFNGGNDRLENEFGVYAVGGVDVPLNKRIVLFCELMFRQVNANYEGLQFGAVFHPDEFDDFEVDFSGPQLNLGLQLGW